MPACVVLDLHMPNMNGFDVLSHLASSPTAVVVVTAYDSPESKQRSLAGGAAAYLTKPLEAKTLVDAARVRAIRSEARRVVPVSQLGRAAERTREGGCAGHVRSRDLDRGVGRGERSAALLVAQRQAGRADLPRQTLDRHSPALLRFGA